MAVTAREARAQARRSGQIWATGKQDALVCVNVTFWQDGAFTATAEDEHVTLGQFRRALERVFPGWAIKARNDGRGYLRADGEPGDDAS